ncbi:MAG: HAMP domain-containing histidine kinase [Clostridia bacterium]|nr:HAMP domain-containing histidine kinase [Clostridia bacterium]
MKEGISSNPEVRRTVLKLSLAMVVLTAIMLLCTYFFWASLNKSMIERDLSIIGNLLDKHPELQGDILPAFTQEGSLNQHKKGIEAARKFGYDDRLPVNLNPLADQYSRKSYRSVLFFCLLCFGCILGIVYLSFKGLFHRVRETASAAERIVEGDFNSILKQENEGDFAKLGHQFNEMAKRLQLTLEEVQSEKVFLKNTIFDISHQLKTPLASIKIFNELLAEEISEGIEVKREFVEKTAAQVERMEWLIKHLLLIAKLEAGTVEFQMARQSLSLTVKEVIESLRLRWEQKTLEVALIENSDIIMSHDREWIGEAISNILKNCIEHTGMGRKIEIELAETSVMTRMIIRDQGEGIHKEDLPHIFKRFYKGRNKLHGNGTGIGLALAKSIIESHAGIIRAESVLGEGTTFIITFPKGVI